MLSWTWYKRSEEHAVQRRQGTSPEHEDFLEKILGDNWQATALQLNKKSFVHECRTNAQVYFKPHKLPIHPNLTTKTKHNTDNNSNKNTNNNYTNNRYNNTQDSYNNQTQTGEEEQEGANET